LVEVEKFGQENVVKLLVGNKCDLESERQVSKEEGKEMAAGLGVKFLETSAKEANNVETAFFTMSNEIRANVQ
jgi:GTPase SAR1 family protein